MVEIKMCAGKCKCGNRLEMRLTDIKVNEKNPKSKVEAWMIHGFCTKCKIVFFQQLFFQEAKPIIDRDFMVDWNEICKGEPKSGELNSQNTECEKE